MTFFKAFKWINNFIFNIQRGVAPDKFSIVTIEGLNENVGMSFEDITTESIAEYPFASAQAILDIVSLSVLDTLAGTGAQKLLVEGLVGADLLTAVEDSEVVDLDGTTIVTTVKQFLRVNNVTVIQAGSTSLNQGKITVTSQAAGTPLLATIEPERGTSLQAIYTVPSDKTAHAFGGWFSTNQNNAGQIEFYIRPPGGAWITRRTLNLYQSATQHNQDVVPFNIIPSGSDCRIRAIAAAVPISVSAGFSMVIVKN